MSQFMPASMFKLIVVWGGLILLWGPVSGIAQPKLPSIPGSLPKLDLNTASIEQLQKLPGLNQATAKQIIAGRPFKSVDELQKVGLSKPTIDQLAPMLTVGDVAKEATPPEAVAKVPPQRGMVWVNTESGIFFRESDRMVWENQGG